MTTVSTDLEKTCVNVIRGLAMDAVQKANSGHPGLPMGAAVMAYVLWTRHLRHNPKNPQWFNRDRFILSAGHGSMLLYSLLYLTGYDLGMDDLKQFRQWGSRTPGHPENTHTPGVEVATGPLGQGFGMAVGIAIAEAHLRNMFDGLVDHHTFIICSDGDLMEGITQEAASLAGHLQLDHIIALYDDNHITIDGHTEITFTDDTPKKFEALGWHVQSIDGMDSEQVEKAINTAKATKGKPHLIACRTTIGYGSPNRANTAKAHGSPLGEDEVLLSKRQLGIPEDEKFWVPKEALDFYREAVSKGEKLEREWNDQVVQYKKANLGKAGLLEAILEGKDSGEWKSKLPTFSEPISTRNAFGQTLNAIADSLPNLIGGAADLADNVMTKIKSSTTFSPDDPAGRNIAFGIREHALAAALNGIIMHQGLRGFGGTFLIFSDYCKPSVRLAALMKCPTIFAFSHDSIGLGEDGPTHQPVEQLTGLRAIPDLNVMRPADGNETAACWQIAIEEKHRPSAIITTRQNLPPTTPSNLGEYGAKKGAYILAEASGGAPKLIIVACGSEVQVALGARDLLEAQGTPTRVVSMPSMFLFEQQTKDYKANILPKTIPTVSVEAGATLCWGKYAQAFVGLDHFGASAPGETVMRELGFTPENVVKVAKTLLG